MISVSRSGRNAAPLQQVDNPAEPWSPLVFFQHQTLVLSQFVPPDSRIEEFARESLKRQAQQNEQMASQSREMAEAARELVKTDGAARQESLQLQQAMIERDATARTELNRLQQDAHTAMQQERAAVDRQKSELDTERRQLREQAGRDPIIAAAISAIGLLLVCLLPLALAAYAMYVITRNSEDDRIVSELLITDLASDEPCLLPTVRYLCTD